MRKLFILFAVLTAASQTTFAAIDGVKMPPDDGKLRIIAFGAHPDDCELQVGGTASMVTRAPSRRARRTRPNAATGA